MNNVLTEQELQAIRERCETAWWTMERNPKKHKGSLAYQLHRDVGMLLAEVEQLKAELDAAIEIINIPGYCTHYPGHICDEGYPDACPDCIRELIRERITEK